MVSENENTCWYCKHQHKENTFKDEGTGDEHAHDNKALQELINGIKI